MWIACAYLNGHAGKSRAVIDWNEVFVVLLARLVQGLFSKRTISLVSCKGNGCMLRFGHYEAGSAKNVTSKSYGLTDL
jgi:hypothetical protein